MKRTKTAKRPTARAVRSARARVAHASNLDRLLRLMSRAPGKSIVFEIAATQDSEVYVAGSFNDWNPTTHPLRHHPEDGSFKAALHLPPGRHEYKYVVNGVWQLDAHWPHRVATPLGTLNNVVRV